MAQHIIFDQPNTHSGTFILVVQQAACRAALLDTQDSQKISSSEIKSHEQEHTAMEGKHTQTHIYLYSHPPKHLHVLKTNENTALSYDITVKPYHEAMLNTDIQVTSLADLSTLSLLLLCLNYCEPLLFIQVHTR